jgi:ethanolamine utilization protein EutA
VGGRLIKFGKNGQVLYVSPVLSEICDLKVGQIATKEQAARIAEVLAQVLEMAAGLRTRTALLEKLMTRESGTFSMPENPGDWVISFSGGVADCIERDVPWLEYGDLGPVLGRAIRKSRLCQNAYVLGSETIRATVIGAGCHSAQLSGSTVFHRNVEFPLKNLPVIQWDADSWEEEPAVLALKGIRGPSYGQVLHLAEEIAARHRQGPVLVSMQEDMAKALGQALALRLGPDVPILCIDRVKLETGSFLDVGAPVGPALPVVVKTLVLSKQ